MVDIFLAIITHLCIGLSTHSPGQTVWVEELPQDWPRFGLKLSRKEALILTVMLRRKTDVSSLLVHAPGQRDEPWLACVYPQSEVLCTHLLAHSLSSYSPSKIWAWALSLCVRELLRCFLLWPFLESKSFGLQLLNSLPVPPISWT